MTLSCFARWRSILQEKFEGDRVVWPPKVLLPTTFGAHVDASGNRYPRDIGRSTMLSNGHVLFQFGDTFAHDASGKFLGVVHNTCSVLTSVSKPTISSYNSLTEDGKPDTLIKPLPGEYLQRKLVWSFSGIIEVTKHQRFSRKGPITGWTWYELRRTHPRTGANYQYCGLAKVEYDPISKQATTTRVEFGDDYKLFKANEPRFGSLCAVHDGNHVYLYGQVNEWDKRIYVTKVVVDRVTSRNWYKFWNGEDWVYDIWSSVPVMSDMQHGAIFKSKMFGKRSEYQWIFIGCNGQGDNRVQMGRAKSLEGPWDIHTLNYKTYSLDPQGKIGDYSYCVYPHPWVTDTCKEGDIMISWSESRMTGRVLMASLRLGMEKETNLYG